MSTAGVDRPGPVRHDRWFVVLPAATFVVGLVLGGGFIALTSGDAGSDGAAQPTSAPTSTDPNASSSGLTVTVPGSCVDAAELSQDVLDLADRAASAIQDLDAGQLQSLLSDMEDLQQAVRDAADRCREDAAANTD